MRSISKEARTAARDESFVTTAMRVVLQRRPADDAAACFAQSTGVQFRTVGTMFFAARFGIREPAIVTFSNVVGGGEPTVQSTVIYLWSYNGRFGLRPDTRGKNNNPQIDGCNHKYVI